MKKSEIIGKLYDATLKLEEGNLDPKEYHQAEIDVFELNFILEHWKKEYEED